MAEEEAADEAAAPDDDVVVGPGCSSSTALSPLVVGRLSPPVPLLGSFSFSSASSTTRPLFSSSLCLCCCSSTSSTDSFPAGEVVSIGAFLGPSVLLRALLSSADELSC